MQRPIHVIDQRTFVSGNVAEFDRAMSERRRTSNMSSVHTEELGDGMTFEENLTELEDVDSEEI